MNLRQKYEEVLATTKDDNGDFHQDEARVEFAGWLQQQKGVLMELAEKTANEIARNVDRMHRQQYQRLIEQPALFGDTEILMPLGENVRRSVADWNKDAFRRRKDLTATQFAGQAGAYSKEVSFLDVHLDRLVDEEQTLADWYRDQGEQAQAA